MSFVRVRVESTGKESAFGQEIGVETPLVLTWFISIATILSSYKVIRGKKVKYSHLEDVVCSPTIDEREYRL